MRFNLPQLSLRILILLLLAWRPAFADPLQQALDEAQRGIEQYRSGRYQQALQYFVKAAELDPKNEDYVVNSAILSEQLGITDQALPYFQRAVQIAAGKGDFDSAGSYSAKVMELSSQIPAWVEQKLEGASAVSEERAAQLPTWSAAYEQIGPLVQQQQLDQAIVVGGKALELAQQILGEHHPGTINTRRELAIAHFYSGNGEEAQQQLVAAERDAIVTFGEEHPETQAVRTLMAELLLELGDHEQSLTWYERAIQGYRAGLGGTHPRTLQTLQVAAQVEEIQGEYGASAKRLMLACSGYSQRLGGAHSEIGSCYRQLGLMQFRNGEYAKARFSYGKAEKVLSGLVGEGHPEWIQNQIYRADLARATADYAQAEEILKQITADTVSAALQFEARGILAQLLEDQGRYPEAEQESRAILTYETESLGELHPNTITTLNNVAGLQRRQSRFIEAEKGYELALERFSQTLGEGHPSTIAIMNNLALTLENQGLYDRAEPLFRTALRQSKSVLGESHPTTLANLNNLAMLHESQGSFDKSEPLYQQAIDLLDGSLGETHPDTVAVRNNLAYLYLLQEKNEQAAELFEEVLTVWQESLGERHQKTLKGMNNLGRVAHGLEDLERAEALIGRALELRREVLGEDHIDTLRSQHDLAKLYLDLERYEESETLLRKTLEQNEQHLGEQHPYTFETLNTLAALQLATEDLESAFETQRILFERRNRFLDQMLWATSENAREGYIRLHRPELNRYMAMVAQLEPEQAGEELLRISLFRKGLLLQVASQIHQVSKLSEDPALTEISDALMAARKELAALTLSGPTEETATTFLETTHELEDQINELEGELGRASIRFREAAADISLERLQESLPDGTALVDFLIHREGEESYLQAAILRKEEEETAFSHHLYEDLAGINEAIQEFRELIQDEDADDDEVMEFGMEVYEKVWAPVVEQIGELETVYVVPDGMLNILPFNAMVNEEESYLLQAIDLHTLSSSRDLIPSDMPLAEGGYMIMAGPDYDTDEVTGKALLQSLEGKRSAAAQQSVRGMSHGLRGLHFDPLPGAEKEGRLIEEQTAEQEVMSQVLLKKEAQEQVLRVMEQPPEVLHIATHGFFLKPDENLKKRLRKLQRGADLQLPPPGDNPLLRAGLAFSGLNANAPLLGEIDTDNDGVLTALEVLGLDLTGTRLAVLSACETGLGEIHEGEGVYGLRRSFQEAGVGAVVNSLWEVSDAGTQALMTGLYQRMLEGESTHEALRNTQLEMLDSDEWSYPYVWSAFFMVEGTEHSDS